MLGLVWEGMSCLLGGDVSVRHMMWVSIAIDKGRTPPYGNDRKIKGASEEHMQG